MCNNNNLQIGYKYNIDSIHEMMFDVYILPIIVKLCDEQNKKYPRKYCTIVNGKAYLFDNVEGIVIEHLLICSTIPEPV